MPRLLPRCSLWIALAAGACAESHSPPAASEAAPDDAAPVDMDAIAARPANTSEGQAGSSGARRDAGTKPSAVGTSVPNRSDASSAAARDAMTSTDAALHDAGGPSEVVFEVLTKPLGGSDYEPRNVGAIWVEDENGAPIKLLELWAAVSARFLTTFSKTGLTPPFPPRIGVDGVTGATLREHRTHRAVWDLTDREGVVVADGVYVVRVEVTDSHDATAVAAQVFYKGPLPVAYQQDESETFGPITLAYH